MSEIADSASGFISVITEPGNRHLLHFIVLLIMPLLVTIVLFLLFQNTATWTNASKTQKLGGAAAAYVILLGISFGIYNNIEPDDPLANTRQSLVGEWLWESSNKESDTKVKGSATLRVNETGDVELIGRNFNRSVLFEASEILITESRLVFFWEVRLPEPSHGVAKLDFHSPDDREIKSMEGFWFSMSGSSGIVKYYRD